MEVKKSSSEKRVGVKFGGLGGGGLLVVVGGALVAATLWSFGEFRRRRNPNPSFKKRALKDFQEKVMNGVDVADQMQGEEKDMSPSNRLLGVEKRSKLEIIEEEDEEEIQGGKIEKQSIDETVVLYQEEDCDDVAEPLSYVSEDDDMMLVEKTELIQFAPHESVADGKITCEKKTVEVVQFMTFTSEELEYEGEDGSEGDSRGTSDFSESNNEAAWPVEPLDALSDAVSDSIECERKLTSIQTEIFAVDENETKNIISTNGIYHNDNVSIHNARWSSTSKNQMMVQGKSTNARIWVSTVLLALLVVLAAFLAQHKDFTPALARHLSSINDFLPQ